MLLHPTALYRRVPNLCVQEDLCSLKPARGHSSHHICSHGLKGDGSLSPFSFWVPSEYSRYVSSTFKVPVSSLMQHFFLNSNTLNRKIYGLHAMRLKAKSQTVNKKIKYNFRALKAPVRRRKTAGRLWALLPQQPFCPARISGKCTPPFTLSIFFSFQSLFLSFIPQLCWLVLLAWPVYFFTCSNTVWIPLKFLCPLEWFQQQMQLQLLNLFPGKTKPSVFKMMVVVL